MSAEQPPLLWEPSPARVEAAALTGFAEAMAERHGREFPDYESLWRWSVDDLEGFWGSVWDYFGVRASRSYDRVLESREMPGARWFPGARLNYAENVLESRSPSAVAVIHSSESRDPTMVSGAELRTEVARVAGGLRALGVTRGDRVVAYMPNTIETLVAFLATSSVGAIWSCVAPELGVESALARFAQLSPKVLFAVDGYVYGGKPFDRTADVQTLRSGLSSLETTVHVPYLDPASKPDPGPGVIGWDELGDDDTELIYEQLPFDHPLWVLYSSGTTGLPKGIVHGHGGVLLEQLKLSHLHLDLDSRDLFFWFTTSGWGMWNILVGALLTGATLVLHDGKPSFPTLDSFWRRIEELQITVLGTSPAFLMQCAQAGIRPGSDLSLDSLKTIGSTGSVLAPDQFEWVYEAVKSDLWLTSISGGTEVVSAFLCGSPTLPVRAGEIQCRALGAAVEAHSEGGTPVIEELAELVLTAPLPSMPTQFWNDPSGEKYRGAYFADGTGVWKHGDWVKITASGSAIVTGRSDATINRYGVRAGTSEIYRAVRGVAGVLDALVVELPGPDGESFMPLFVVLDDSVVLADSLRDEIRAAIRQACSPRLLPDEILEIDEVPRTLTGKTLEVPVKRILMGFPPGAVASRDAVANPESLDYFIAMASSLSATRAPGE